MNRVPYKTRMGMSVGLVLLSIIIIIATVICGAYGVPIWLLVLLSVAAALTFVMGIIFVPKTNEDGTPFVIGKKSKKKKPKRHKDKKPFVTDKEWKEQEEEDDEMVFVEEVVEDD